MILTIEKNNLVYLLPLFLQTIKILLLGIRRPGLGWEKAGEKLSKEGQKGNIWKFFARYRGRHLYININT